MDIDAANDVKHTHNPPTDRDDRSSSLSEIGDQADQEQPDNIFHLGSDANDTEAETERLEESPQKQRKHQNIILTSSNGIYDDHQSLLANHVTQDHTVRGGKLGIPMRRLIQLIS